MKERSPFFSRNLNMKVTQSEGEAEILLYDEIGFFGISANEFVSSLKDIEAETIHLRINSPGGSVFDGTAIYNALKDHPAKIITHVDALAASMASIIALAGDEVLMAENAFFMIHDPWTLTIGNATQLRKDADLLDKITTSTIKTAYQAKTGKSEAEIAAWMTDETWFTAEEALANGFIDRIEKKTGVKAAFDLSVFSKTPKALKMSDEEITKRDLERALRDAGLSRENAKAVIAKGFEALSPRDAETEDLVTAAKDFLRLLAA